MPNNFTSKSTASISAQNIFCDPIQLSGPFNFSLSGTWSATVWLQRSYDGGSTWLDVQGYTANVEDAWSEHEVGVLWRFGVKTGGYTSGTVIGRMSQ
ncbi:MAG: hypothetical protein ACKVSF_10235 [Alphaproteobacteria bacterium]